MKRPLLIVALLYGSGILGANFLPRLSPFVLLALGVLVALLCVFSALARPVLVWPLLVLAGAANFSLRTALLSPHDLRAVVPGEAEIVSIFGTLTETPSSRVYEHEGEPSWRTLATIEVTSLRRPGRTAEPAAGRVVVSTPGVLAPSFFGGCGVDVEGVLRRPPPPVVEGQFDYQTYLRRHGIYFQLQAASTNDWRLAAGVRSSAVRPLADRFGAWAKATLARGLPVEDEPLRLLWAMALGWKTALNGEVAEPFMRSGTMHIFAISGLHIALIAGILVVVFRVFKIPRAVTGALVIPLIWFYTYATGWQPSAIRSTIMMTVILAGWSLRRPSDLLNSLAAAAFVILLWEPQQLFQASFQLSFFVVLSLALFSPVLERVQRAVLATDPLLPAPLIPRWRQWLRAPLHHVTGAFTTSLAAWLGSIPLVAYYFNLFTPISLLANMVVVPLSSAALACTMASLAVGGWFPAGAELFNHAAWFFMFWMIRLSEGAAALPGAWFHIGMPSALAFVWYYTALIGLMTGWLWKPRVRVGIGTVLVVLGVAWFAQGHAERATIRLTIIPLNGGEAIYSAGRGPAGDLLIDCGNQSAAQFIIKPFLRRQGVTRLDRLLLTHGDVHNVGGAPYVRREYGVRQVYLSPVSFRSANYKEVQGDFEKVPGLTRPIRRGDKVDPWLVLHPDEADRFPQADDNAVALRAEYEGVRILLLSDLGTPGQNVLLERGADMRADLVVSGVPARSEPLAEALLDAIQPRAIVITDSVYPATARASRRLHDRLKARNIPVFFTRERGAITVSLRRGEWELQSPGAMLYSSREAGRVEDDSTNQP